MLTRLETVRAHLGSVRPRPPLLAAAACAALLAASCSSGEATPAPGGGSASAEGAAEVVEPGVSDGDGVDFPAGWQPDPLIWGRCTQPLYEALECATLEVPMDWAAPDGEQIELALGRRAARGERIGSLLSNPGGPGGSGLEYLALSSFTPELASSFDLVSWDPRGIGASTPIECDDSVGALRAADPEPDDRAERDAIEQAALAVAQDCEEAEGEYLEHVHTVEVARDLEAIRLALGGEPLNYIGFSYGTHIGQVYAEMFGGQLRAMVLDGVVDPSQALEDFLLGQTAAFEALFARQRQQCALAGEASCSVQDLAAAYDEVSVAVESATRDSDHGTVGPSELATAATYVGYIEDGWAPLGEALRSALEGDWGPLRLLADSYRDLVAYGPYAAVVCTDSERPEGFEEYQDFERRAAAISTRFGAAIANEMLPCAVWGSPTRGEAAAVTAPDAPPILVVGNTGDPATPIENARTVADSLVSGQLLEVDSDGHVAFGSQACATDVIERYLLELALPGPGAVC